MHTKVRVMSPEVVLARVLDTLEQELIDASDEEIMEAAKGLGMNPEMKGSGAFIGVKYPVKPQLSDFFEFEACRNAQIAAEPAADSTQMQGKLKTPQPKQLEVSKKTRDFGKK